MYSQLSTSSKSFSCIFSRIPNYFKLCLFLCLMCIFIIYYSTIFWQNGFQGNRIWSSNLTMSKFTENGENRRISAPYKTPDANDWSKMCAGDVTKTEIDRLFPPRDEMDAKYILASYSYQCAGLGNQMYRFASLYGIGKPYRRSPIFTEDQRCHKGHGPHDVEGDEDEVKNLFPIFDSQLKYIQKLDINHTFVLEKFATDCCKYDDPQRIKFSRFKQKYVQIKSTFFQSYKFFETRRHEIRQIFQFAPAICDAVQKYRAQLFRGEETAHKFCVHTRLGDFKNYGYQSNTKFTEKSIEFAYRHLRKSLQDGTRIALILLGADKDFLTSIKINRTFIPNVHVPKPSPRGFDLAFATTVCDSLLITAPASTFSWWIGYLMPDEATVYYNAEIEQTPYERQNFLPEWIPLRMVNGQIELD